MIIQSHKSVGSISAWSPLDIAGAAGYLDARFLGDITLAGTAVISWRDRTGNTSLNVTDGGVAARRPVYNMALSRIEFDGVNHWLESGAYAVNQPCTLLIKTRMNAVTNASVSDGSQVLNSRVMFCLNGGIADAAIYAGASLSTAAGQLPAVSPGIIIGIYNGASSSVRVGTGTVASGNAGANNGSGWTMGARQAGSSKATCEIYWALLYSRALTNTEILTLIANMP